MNPIFSAMFSLLISLMLTTSAVAAESALVQRLQSGLKESAGIVMAAGWTGGGKVQIAPVPVSESGPVADKPGEAPKPPALQSLQRLVAIAGSDFPKDLFNKMARVLGIPEIKENEPPAKAHRIVIDAEKNYDRILVFRTRADGTVDVNVFYGQPDVRLSFLADMNGRLLKAQESRPGQGRRELDATAAAQIQRFQQEIDAWKAWEVAENRRRSSETVAQGG